MTPTNRASFQPALIITGLGLVGLAGHAAMGLLQLDYVYAFPLSVIWSIACYVIGFGVVKRLRSREPGVGVTVAHHIVAAVLIFGASASVVGYFRSLAWDPIGETSDLGLGAAPCHVLKDRITANGFGRVIVTRRDWCDLGFGVSASSYFIFIRGLDEASDRNNIVLRYDTTGAGWENGPSVRWRSASLVEIFVLAGAVKRIIKMKRVQDGVFIVYDLPKLERKS